jgi:ABC-type ATPase involved in cell division
VVIATHDEQLEARLQPRCIVLAQGRVVA